MPTLEYNGFKYVVTNPRDFNEGLKIEYEGDMPEHLYKYYSPNEHNLQALIKQELYFSHPYRFNDIMDSNMLSFDFSEVTFEKFEELLKNTNYKHNVRELYDDDKLNGFSFYRFLFYSLLYQIFGILSLSENEMHDLMWGHYSTDNGFRVKFETDGLVESLKTKNGPNLKIFPINYTIQKLQVDTKRYGVEIPILVDFSTKVKTWSYEKEWRIIMSKPDMEVPYKIKTPKYPNHEGKDSRLFRFDIKCIKEIVLGMNFFNGNTLKKSNRISGNKVQVTVMNEVISNFLDLLIEYIPNNIYQAGIYVDPDTDDSGTKRIGRSTEAMEIEKIDKLDYVIQRNNPESLSKF